MFNGHDEKLEYKHKLKLISCVLVKTYIIINSDTHACVHYFFVMRRNERAVKFFVRAVRMGACEGV